MEKVNETGTQKERKHTQAVHSQPNFISTDKDVFFVCLFKPLRK